MTVDERQAATVEAILSGMVPCRICFEPCEPERGPRVYPTDPDLPNPAPKNPFAVHADFDMCQPCLDSWWQWEKHGHDYWKAWKKHRKHQVGRFD